MGTSLDTLIYFQFGRRVLRSLKEFNNLLRKLLDRQQCKREESFASVSFPVSQLSELGYPPNGLALKYLNSESIRVFTVVDATLLDRQTQHKHRTMRQPVGQQSLSTMSVRDVLRD